MEFNVDTFSQGMNMVRSSTKLQPGEYVLGVNVRSRYDMLENVLGVKEITANLPPYTILQGHYTVDKYHIIFIDGYAYYRDVVVSDIWTKIAGFRLSSSAPQIYAELVAASSTDFQRKPTSSNVNEGVDLIGPASGSDGGLVCQDGVNQPWIILADATARRLAAYNEWEDDPLGVREYVPIGTLMCFSNGILYLVKDNLIYRSVSGRPLDFMVKIKADGTKEATEDLGGAQTVAYGVDANVITAIAETDVDNSALFVSTERRSYLVIPNFTATVFGEPTFGNLPLANTGCLNQFSALMVNGNVVFPTKSGLRAFNPTHQVKFEGRNTPFSRTIAKLFKNVRQNYTASINYDDYALFAMLTIYGFAIVVYDTLNQCFASIDMFPELESLQPTQFAIAKVSGEVDFLYLMGNNKLYQLYIQDTAIAQYYAGEFCSNINNIEQKPQSLGLTFNDVVENGTITIKCFIDRKLVNTTSKALTASSNVETVPIDIPFGDSSVDTTRNISFPLDSIKKNGWKVGFLISWDFQATLTHVNYKATERRSAQSDQEASLVRTP